MSPPTNQHPTFDTGRMPLLSPNQQCQSIEGKMFITHYINALDIIYISSAMARHCMRVHSCFLFSSCMLHYDIYWLCIVQWLFPVRTFLTLKEQFWSISWPDVVKVIEPGAVCPLAYHGFLLSIFCVFSLGPVWLCLVILFLLLRILSLGQVCCQCPCTWLNRNTGIWNDL